MEQNGSDCQQAIHNVVKVVQQLTCLAVSMVRPIRPGRGAFGGVGLSFPVVIFVTKKCFMFYVGNAILDVVHDVTIFVCNPDCLLLTLRRNGCSHRRKTFRRPLWNHSVIFARWHCNGARPKFDVPDTTFLFMFLLCFYVLMLTVFLRHGHHKRHLACKKSTFIVTINISVDTLGCPN